MKQTNNKEKKIFSSLTHKLEEARAGEGSCLNDQDILLQKTLFKGGQDSCLDDQAILLQKTLIKGGQCSCLNDQAKLFQKTLFREVV